MRVPQTGARSRNVICITSSSPGTAVAVTGLPRISGRLRQRAETMPERLDGAVALVTGASSGIGEATARALARQGAAVAVAARRKDRLDALAGEIDCLVIEADIADRDQATEAVQQTVGELGRLDTVINNAGVMLLGD